MDIDKLFDGMAKAEIFGRGNYMSEGLYIVETKNLFVKDGFKGKSFVAEFTIVESNNEKHAVGTSGSWVLKFTWPATFGHITKFVTALLGYDPNQKANQDDPKIRKQVELVTRAACGSDAAKKELGPDGYEEGMLNGIRLRLECSMQKTAPKPGKPEGGDFTSYAWSPIAPEADAA
jgi:hypothetical protein